MNKLIASVLLATALPAALLAAIPQHWTVETSRVQPAQFEAFHGETIELAATMQSYGKPLAITNDLIGIYWQTNGMGSAYWTAPAVLSNNVMIARWEPSMDVGANVYSCFIGAPGEIYRAAFQLRLRPSPGANPSELPLPVQAIDFAQIEVRNAPYYTRGETDARIIELSPPADLSPAFAYTTAVSNKLEASKQAVIADLDTIRSGAALGATALQSYTEIDPTVADWAKKPNPAPVTDLTPAYDYTTAVSNKLEASKQDVIDDLDDIRTGAVLGATALRAAHNTSANAHEDIRETVGNKVDAYTINCDYYTLDSEHDYPLWKQYPGIYISDPIYRPDVDTLRYKLTINGYDATFTFEVFEGGTWVERMSLPGTVDRDTLDVTVSGMKITKHNHEIYNDTAPKAKALADYDIESDLSSSPTNIPTSSAVSAALAALSDTVDSKLDKSGGTMTGNLNIPGGYIFMDDSGESYEGTYLYHDHLQVAMYGDKARLFPTQLESNGEVFEFPEVSGTLALTSDIPDVDDKIEAHDESETAHADIRNTVNNLADNVSTWSSFWSGDDVRVTVTNYDSAVNLPSLYIEYKLSNGLFRTVWDERTRWNANELRMAALESAVEGKADRAWGYYDSHTGGWAPDGYTWLSSPKIAISGGMAYQKHVTSEGAVWVLESNGLIAESGGVMSNGFFRISDDEGNPLFEIVKGDKRTVGATAGSCVPLAGYAITHLQIGYAVESADHPKIYVTRSLTPVDWKAEDDADCPATVSWSGSSGNWTAVVAGKVAEAQLFVKAEYEVGGNTYIKQSAPVSVQKLVLGGNEYRVGTATISGHTVLTLTLEP